MKNLSCKSNIYTLVSSSGKGGQRDDVKRHLKTVSKIFREHEEVDTIST